MEVEEEAMDEAGGITREELFVWEFVRFSAGFLNVETAVVWEDAELAEDEEEVEEEEGRVEEDDEEAERVAEGFVFTGVLLLLLLLLGSEEAEDEEDEDVSDKVADDGGEERVDAEDGWMLLFWLLSGVESLTWAVDEDFLRSSAVMRKRHSRP